jgi:hypothetical protein
MRPTWGFLKTKYGDTGDTQKRGMPILWTDFEESNSHLQSHLQNFSDPYKVVPPR